MKKSVMLLIATMALGFGTASAATGNPRCAMPGAAMCQPGPGMKPMGGPQGRWENCGATSLQKQLGLSEEQNARVEKLCKTHFGAMDTEREKLMTLNQELKTESLKANPDKKKIDDISERIGQQHTAMAHLKSAHLAELASVLTPAQLEKMQGIITSRPMGGRCGMRF